MPEKTPRHKAEIPRIRLTIIPPACIPSNTLRAGNVRWVWAWMQACPREIHFPFPAERGSVRANHPSELRKYSPPCGASAPGPTDEGSRGANLSRPPNEPSRDYWIPKTPPEDCSSNRRKWGKGAHEEARGRWFAPDPACGRAEILRQPLSIGLLGVFLRERLEFHPGLPPAGHFRGILALNLESQVEGFRRRHAGNDFLRMPGVECRFQFSQSS